MIIQTDGDGLLLFRQTDHALLSGEFATVWGNDRIPAPPRREQTLIAASRHDDGWAEWELAPKLRPDGEPVDFIRVPVSDHAPLYKRGVDLVQAEDDFAGLIVSLHFDRLYTRPFHPGMDPRIDHLTDDALALAQEHVAGERERQAKLLASLDADAQRDADECWRLLQVWDRLSLLVCMNRIDPSIEQQLPPIASVDGDVRIVARGTADGDLTVDPYPFAEDGVAFDIAFVRTDRTNWPDEPSYRRVFRSAPHGTLRFRCVTGR
jgi:hypothetical protein